MQTHRRDAGTTEETAPGSSKPSNTAECRGLCDGRGRIHDECRDAVRNIFSEINGALAK